MKKSSKLASSFLCVVMAVLMLAACGQKPPSSSGAGGGSSLPISTPDSTPSTPDPVAPASEHRIICLAPSMVEVVYALGLGDNIVGWSLYSNYPEEVTQREGWVPYGEYEFVSIEDELAKDVAVVSFFSTYEADLVAALEPTVILAESDMQFGMYEELLAEGYNVLFHSPTTLDEVYEMIRNIGEALDVGDTAKALVDGYEAEIAEIRAITETLPKVEVYLEIAHRKEYDGVFFGPYATCSGSPFDQMLEIAGGVNVFESLDGDYVAVEFEDIVAANPDVILSPMWPDAMEDEITTIYEIMTREGFEDIKAVQNSRVYFYDSSLFKRFGPRSIIAIKKLAYLLHPYYFDSPPEALSPWELGRIDVTYIPEHGRR